MSSYPPKDRFSHQKSKYERPTLDYQCGRAALWGKPCARGPDANGVCGGIAECQPAKKDDRWQCRRPGGSCEQGPLPDGTCCQTQPPCSPVPSIRRRRGQAVIFFLLMSLATLIGLAVYSQVNTQTVTPDNNGEQDVTSNDLAGADGTSTFSILSPGRLSDMHSAFTHEQGCQSCHVPETTHEGDGLSDTPSLLGLANHLPLSEGCTSCHTFGGPAATPHNLAAEEQTLECQSCHTEHAGRFATLTTISNQQCAACHEQKFDNFAEHPQFSDRFPYLSAGGIIFDHQKHLEFHFGKAKNQAAVPTACTSCHNPEGAGNRVEIAGFDDSCGACHEGNINDSAKTELALLSLPNLKIKSEEGIAAYTACGAETGERFKAQGKGRSNPFTDWLIGARLKQTDEYAAGFCELLQGIEKSGLNALLDKFAERSDFSANELFRGLTPEVLSVLTSNWIGNERYRPSSKLISKDVVQTGWVVNKKGELNYRPDQHADQVAMQWLKFASELRVNNADDKLATRLADAILTSDGGLGACMKCHVPAATTQTADVADASEVDYALWARAQQEDHHRVKFDHSAHLRFVGAGTAGLTESGVGCALCHEINPESNYLESMEGANEGVTYESNFHSLKTQTCSQCHNEQSIQDDCTTCHVYHESPGFTPKLNTSLGREL